MTFAESFRAVMDHYALSAESRKIAWRSAHSHNGRLKAGAETIYRQLAATVPPFASAAAEGC